MLIWDLQVLACLSFRPKTVIEFKNQDEWIYERPRCADTDSCSPVQLVLWKEIFPPITCQEITQKQWEQRLGVWVAETRLTLRWQKVLCWRSGYQSFKSYPPSLSRGPFAAQSPGGAAVRQDRLFLWCAVQGADRHTVKHTSKRFAESATELSPSRNPV